MGKAEKREAVERLLGNGDTMLCIDSRHPGVDVPEVHMGKADLRLILNTGFRHPVSVQEHGIDAELLFGGAAWRCWIPYESLWCAFNPNTGETAIWPELIPEEVSGMPRPAGPIDEKTGPVMVKNSAPTSEPKNNGKKEKPHLRVIKGAKKD